VKEGGKERQRVRQVKPMKSREIEVKSKGQEVRDVGGVKLTKGWGEGGREAVASPTFISFSFNIPSKAGTTC